jgi:glutaconate CoA-transferase subunit B
MTDTLLPSDYTSDEIMTVVASRTLGARTVCFVGIGLPSTAANLARRLHAPDCVLVYESGCIGAKPSVLPLSIGDGVLAEHADSVVSVTEMFGYWLQAGRIDVGFLSAAQIDAHANLNTTVIGDYRAPVVRLPGAGGAPEIAASCGEVIITIRQNPRTFVDRLDFITSVGHGEGGDHRERLGLRGKGPTAVITDLGILPEGLHPVRPLLVLTLPCVQPLYCSSSDAARASAAVAGRPTMANRFRTQRCASPRMPPRPTARRWSPTMRAGSPPIMVTSAA